jgi:serine phosphatase RsbU (regulator of sigma subunit)/type II secretory pathway pseudopilin PulG
MPGLRLRPLTVVVAVLLLAITAVLTVLTWQADARSERSILDRQLAQVGSLLSNQAAVDRTVLADIGQVAVNTQASPTAFARWAERELQETHQSLSLWRVADGHAQRLANKGEEPHIGDGAPLVAVPADGQLKILGIRHGATDRITYALAPQGGNGLVVYAEAPLPRGHRLPATKDSPLEGLDVALYLGKSAAPEQLLESTAPTPIRGATRTAGVPFGNTTITIVGASPTHLTGTLAAALPWVVLGVGCVLALGGAAVLETVTRRRLVAEGLARENERLYREQRGIAGTLQHALLPAVPRLDGLDVAARYVAGVDRLDVGGDWYDVIPGRPGCLTFVVGDVSGRGLPAATTMASLRFAVRAYLAEGSDVETVLTKLRRLLDIDVDHQFATLLLGELDVERGTLRLVSAGHFGPLLLRDGRAELLEVPAGPPVGVAAPHRSQAVTVPVGTAATLVAFTDGAVERRGEVVDVGLERLRSAAAEVAERPLEGMLDDLLAGLTGETTSTDDTVLLGMRWTSRTNARTRD